MKIRDYMTTDPVCANLKDGLHQTYTRMRERNIRHMPVLDDAGKLAGIVSERDLLRPDYVDSDPNVSGYFALDNKVKVSAAMTGEPVTVSPEMEVAEALSLFLYHRFGALPVIDDEGTLVGILSTIDMLWAFQKHLEG